ncbi:MAG: glycosyltransferase [Solirubrobacteraceae bacterium]
MPPDGALALLTAPRHLRLVARPLRVVDVALFYGERSGGIRTYLDAKARFAATAATIEHHVIVPGTARATTARAGATVHTIRSVTVNRANGYRLPLGGDALAATLRGLHPDVVLLHDSFWRPRQVCRLVQQGGGVAVMVHHGSAELDAHAWPGPAALYARGFRAWLQHAYVDADAVMSACDPWKDTHRTATIPLRLGLHQAFVPQPAVHRGDHVLYVGRLAREKGILTLLEAAARSRDAWSLRLIGSGPAEGLVRARARRLGIEQRLQVRPFVADPEALAREYAGARCVVMPGHLETFGLVALEGAACGAPVVACETAPSVAALGARCRTFPAQDAARLLTAIECARTDLPDRGEALALARNHSWNAAFAAELADVRELAGC